MHVCFSLCSNILFSIDLFRLYILFSQYKSCANTQDRVWKGGSWSRIPAPFTRESRIPRVFHQFPESRFSFPEKYIKLINVRCRLILSIDILNLCVFSKASAKRNSFFFLPLYEESWHHYLPYLGQSSVKAVQKNPLNIIIKVRLPKRLKSLIKQYIESITGMS